ncbi:hypothetical protein F5141DRAFT_1190235 [Pisolithus sp. B1]|nr:hypothetical protein F5141DRAFT_1190235 [Pisolithus sp. B1]
MDNVKTRKAWGVYDETGIFIAVCHHGTCLLIVDMVQSGKYGHAHHHLCQLPHLTLYVEGLGLEDLETCEHTFSKSNALTSTVRYATAWLEEEKEYLEGLSCEPLEETLHMEYWQRLGKLEVSRELLLVQDLEHKLNISWRWVLEDKEWQDTGHLVANQEYHHVLDNLESLVVAWLFKLTKMNRAGTAIKVTLNCYNKCALAERFLHTCEEKISNIHSALAHQVSHCCKHHLQFNAILPGFSGTLHPGESALKGPGESNIEPNIVIPSYLLAPIQQPLSSQPLHGDTHQDLEEEDIEHEVEEASHTLQDVLEVSFDLE